MIDSFRKLISKLKKEKPVEIEEEIKNIVNEAEQVGEIDEDKGSLIKSALRFSELRVTDILTPRVDVIGIEVKTPKEDISDKFNETKFSRLIVYNENFDDIIGILSFKDFYSEVYLSEDKTIESVLKPVLFVIATKSIDELLKEFREQKLHMAVVIDEFGGMLGIVTLEDILEVLVGEIWDEHEEIVEDIIEESNGSYTITGNTKINKLIDTFDREIETDATTISGWAMSNLEGIPKENDEFSSDGFVVKITEVQDRRICKLNLKILSDSEETVNG